MHLWFILTEIGWIDTYYQVNPPVYNKIKQDWIGRRVHPFGFRDAQFIKDDSWIINHPYGYSLEINIEPSHYQFYFEKIDVDKMTFQQRLSSIEDNVHIETFCKRLIKLFRADDLPVGTRIVLVQLPAYSPEVVAH